MAVSMKASVVSTSGVARPARTRMVCQAVQGEGNVAKASMAAAAIAAAALISATPVQAGVVLQQPELKKVFQSTDEPQPVKERPFRQANKSAPAAAADAKAEAPKPKVAEESVGDLGIDPRSVALPASIVAIGALGLAASKVDGGFSEWFQESGALVRDSSKWAGFEEELKPDGAYFWNPAPAGATGKVGTVKKTGTKVVKKKK